MPGSLFDTPPTYEDMRRIGSGLGAGGFIVFDDESDLVAHAAARFLAVESCGQCEPCKLDGLVISEHLDAIRTSNATDRDVATIRQKLQTVTRGARCFLPLQQQHVVASVLSLFPEAFTQHITKQRQSATSERLAPVVDIVGGQAVLDTSHRREQPDWTYGRTDSGSFPADLYTDEPVHPTLERAAGAAGEDLTIEPRDEIRSALHRVERILRSGPAPTTGELDEVADLVQQHDDAGEGDVLPMLQDRLHEVHLGKLRDAPATAMKWRTP